MISNWFPRKLSPSHSASEALKWTVFMVTLLPLNGTCNYPLKHNHLFSQEMRQWGQAEREKENEPPWMLPLLPAAKHVFCECTKPFTSQLCRRLPEDPSLSDMLSLPAPRCPYYCIEPPGWNLERGSCHGHCCCHCLLLLPSSAFQFWDSSCCTILVWSRMA